MRHALQRRVAGFALVAFLASLSLPFMGGHLSLVNDDAACGPELATTWDRPIQVQTPEAVQPIQPGLRSSRAPTGRAPVSSMTAVT